MMSWKNWMEVLQDPISLLSLKNSLILGLGGATLGIMLSIFVAYVIVKVRTRAAGILESLSFLSFSFPGIVIGVGFMWFFVRTPLYATLWALLIGYIATYLPYGIRPLSSAFVQIHSHLEESSRVCGASPFYTMRRIVIPLLIPGHRLGLDPDGHHVRARADPLGGALTARLRKSWRCRYCALPKTACGASFPPWAS